MNAINCPVFSSPHILFFASRQKRDSGFISFWRAMHQGFKAVNTWQKATKGKHFQTAPTAEKAKKARETLRGEIAENQQNGGKIGGKIKIVIHLVLRKSNTNF